jgi:hypothetical protein
MMPPYNRATTRNPTRLHSLRLRDPAHSLPPHMTGNSQLLAAAAA